MFLSCLDQVVRGGGFQLIEFQQMVFYIVLYLLIFSLDLIDNIKCWFFKYSVLLFVMVILVNSIYFKVLYCEIKFVG